MTGTTGGITNRCPTTKLPDHFRETPHIHAGRPRFFRRLPATGVRHLQCVDPGHPEGPYQVRSGYTPGWQYRVWGRPRVPIHPGTAEGGPETHPSRIGER